MFEFKNHKEVVKKIKKMTEKQYIDTLIDRDMVKK